jgi:hypothetical protein
MREIMRSLQLPDTLPGKTQSNFWAKLLFGSKLIEAEAQI